MQIDSDVTVTRSPRHVDAYDVDGQIVTATMLSVLAVAVRHRGQTRVLHALQDLRDFLDMESGHIVIRE